MSKALEINNLNKTFNNKSSACQVLKNINLEIKEGEIFGLIGLNGIGKTTLIKSILNLLRIDLGDIKIFNTDKDNPIARKNVCYLPEKFYPSQYLTGYEFLKYSLSFFDKPLNIEEVHRVAKKIDLDVSALKRVVHQYSKGMGQKLGLLYCLLSDAKLLILDEPMTGLDPKARVLLKLALKDYVKHGNTIFFSSHILDDVEEICDTMAVLHNGEIKFIGQPLEFRETYKEVNIEKSFLKCIED